jgi:hypothetical protein
LAFAVTNSVSAAAVAIAPPTDLWIFIVAPRQFMAQREVFQLAA